MESRDLGIIGNIAKRPISFAVTFVIFFCLVLSFLSFADALPNKVAAPGSHASTTAKLTKIVKTGSAEDPVEIKIAKLGLDVHIKNPTSTSVEVLDEALLSGAVRYPNSAKLGQMGTV